MCIRQCSNDLYGMKKGIAAVLHHCSQDNDLERRRQYCSRTNNSWCKSQTDNITGNKSYKSKINIPLTIFEIIKPIFSYNDLASDELLTRCLHWQAQNINESANHTLFGKNAQKIPLFVEQH